MITDFRQIRVDVEVGTEWPNGIKINIEEVGTEWPNGIKINIDSDVFSQLMTILKDEKN